MVSVERRAYLWKTELALAMVERALERGHLRAGWVAGDDAFGMSPSFREGLGALGIRYVLDVPGGTTVWPLDQPSLRSRLDCSLPISTRKLSAVVCNLATSVCKRLTVGCNLLISTCKLSAVVCNLATSVCK